MIRLRPALRWYILAVIAAAVGVLGIAFLDGPAGRVDPILFLVLFALALAARLWVVHLSPKIKFTVEDVATFAAALTLPPLLAMLVAGASGVVHARGGRRVGWYERAFNSAARVLHVGAAAFTFRLLAGGRAIDEDPVAAVVAGIVQYLVGALIVDIAAGLQLYRDPLRSWWMIHRSDIPYNGALYLLGALAALLATRHVLALVLFFIPMVMLVAALREAFRLRERSNGRSWRSRISPTSGPTGTPCGSRRAPSGSPGGSGSRRRRWSWSARLPGSTTSASWRQRARLASGGTAAPRCRPRDQRACRGRRQDPLFGPRARRGRAHRARAPRAP